MINLSAYIIGLCGLEKGADLIGSDINLIGGDALPPLPPNVDPVKPVKELFKAWLGVDLNLQAAKKPVSKINLTTKWIRNKGKIPGLVGLGLGGVALGSYLLRDKFKKD